MRTDREVIEWIKLGVVTVAAAVLTATLVIGIGRALLPQPEAPGTTPEASFTRASLLP